MKKHVTYTLLAAYLFLSGCTNLAEPEISDHGITEPVVVGLSYLAVGQSTESSDGVDEVSADQSVIGVRNEASSAPTSMDGEVERISFLTPIVTSEFVSGDKVAISNLVLEQSEKLIISADNMPVVDFVHYIFGELLQVNYVLGQDFESNDGSSMGTISLSVGNGIDSIALFDLASEVLSKRGINIRLGKNSVYIYHSSDNSAGSPDVVVAIGRDVSDVPRTTQEILQVVPLKFGIKVNLQSNLVRLTGAFITPDHSQNALFVKGLRANVLRALELVELLDVPAARSRYINLVNLSFLTPQDFASEVRVLLETEGVMSESGTPAGGNVVIVPLEKLGAVAVFAATQQLLDRVEYWATLVDVPGGGSDLQYFVYEPSYARAVDIGLSLSELLKLSVSGGVNKAGGQLGANATGSAPSEKRTTGVATEKMKMVVDERANALLFYTTGSEYRAITPILSRLDSLPKQVAMDIVIAEVSLKDEFKFGVEWAVSRGEVGVTTQGAFGATSVGGIGLMINGTEGPLNANFLTSNSLVTVLSNPTLTVLDGVSAQINIGSEIAVVGQTTQDPINGERQTTSSEYRMTGVDVTVMPTINAKGIVVMEISQSISNTVPSSSGANGNPDIFSRSVSTEVVARSGQTVMIGGLISKSASSGGSGAPGLSGLPFLGNLFKSKSNSSDRTELVMLITPRVLDDLDQWESVSGDFRDALRYLKFKEASAEERAPSMGED